MNVEIAERLAARRKQAGLSQEALAAKLGVSRQAVSKWERSESSPDTDNLIALAQLYGVSLDELLYVDESIEDDVAFEAADRAAATASGARAETPGAPTGAAGASASQTTGAVGNGTSGVDDGFAKAAEKAKGKVHVGLDGVHVVDGDNYVHVTWRDGVHVHDGEKGDEVHVGWDGVHVKEGRRASSATGKDGAASEASAESAAPGSGAYDAAARDGAAASNAADESRSQATTDNSAAAADSNAAHRSSNAEGAGSWFSVDAHDDEGHEVRVDADGVVVDGQHFDTWYEAHEYFHGNERGHGGAGGKRPWTLAKAWMKFPFPLVVIVAYLLCGIIYNRWGQPLFLFFLIPLYYMVGTALKTHKVMPLLMGAYPVLATAWFCYMAFICNAPHPAWAIFLTIPLVEALLGWCWKMAKSRRRAKQQAEQAPIDVQPIEAEVIEAEVIEND